MPCPTPPLRLATGFGGTPTLGGGHPVWAPRRLFCASLLGRAPISLSHAPHRNSGDAHRAVAQREFTHACKAFLCFPPPRGGAAKT